MIDPNTQKVLDKYYPCEPENETKNIAKIIVELDEANTMLFQIGLHIGYKKISATMTELERLGIISPYSNGRYNILVKLDEIDKIFDDDPKYKNVQQSLIPVV